MYAFTRKSFSFSVCLKFFIIKPWGKNKPMRLILLRPLTDGEAGLRAHVIHPRSHSSLAMGLVGQMCPGLTPKPKLSAGLVLQACHFPAVLPSWCPNRVPAGRPKGPADLQAA